MFEQNVTYGPGTGTFTQHTFEILIMLLGAFLLGLWLGWILWSKYKQAADKLALDNQSLSAAAEALRVELATMRNNLTSTQADLENANVYVDQLTRRNTQLQDELDQVQLSFDNTKSRNRLLETELGLSFDSDTHVTTQDIPLEIEQTQQQEEEAPVNEPESVEPEHIEAANEPVVEITASDREDEDNSGLPTEELQIDNLVSPILTMPAAADDNPEHELAGMAPLEDMEQTEAFTLTDTPQQIDTEPIQEAPKTVIAPPALVNFTPVAEPGIESQPLAARSIEPDDLTVVEGIGPKIQELLYQYGIRSYQQLAETEVDRIKEILSSAGPQLAMHDPGTWPAQANLAANNQWDNLKSIQGFLKGGKKPD
ncbi:MAG: hypothetical protein WCR52_04645 [Bacteroidota bacterium]